VALVATPALAYAAGGDKSGAAGVRHKKGKKKDKSSAIDDAKFWPAIAPPTPRIYDRNDYARRRFRSWKSLAMTTAPMSPI